MPAHAQKQKRYRHIYIYIQIYIYIYIYIYTHRESLVHNHEPRAKALGNKLLYKPRYNRAVTGTYRCYIQVGNICNIHILYTEWEISGDIMCKCTILRSVKLL